MTQNIPVTKYWSKRSVPEWCKSSIALHSCKVSNNHTFASNKFIVVEQISNDHTFGSNNLFRKIFPASNHFIISVNVTNCPAERIYNCTHPHQRERRVLTSSRSQSRNRNPNGTKRGVKARGDGREGGNQGLPGLDASAPEVRRRIPERRPRLSAVPIWFPLPFVFSPGSPPPVLWCGKMVVGG